MIRYPPDPVFYLVKRRYPAIRMSPSKDVPEEVKLFSTMVDAAKELDEQFRLLSPQRLGSVLTKGIPLGERI